MGLVQWCHQIAEAVMAQFSVNPYRRDPYRNFKFRVKWDGMPVAGVSKVSALRRTTEVVEHREGGDTSLDRKSPGATKFDPIVLERGVTHDTAFEEWANLVFDIQGDAAMSLEKYKKDIVIELLNLQGVVVKAYKVYGCWVSEYQALPDLEANSRVVAIERLVLENEGWERDATVAEPRQT
jgi:phage tail-like protein